MLYICAQCKGLGIDNLKFLLHPKREAAYSLGHARSLLQLCASLQKYRHPAFCAAAHSSRDKAEKLSACLNHLFTTRKQGRIVEHRSNDSQNAIPFSMSIDIMPSYFPRCKTCTSGNFLFPSRL